MLCPRRKQRSFGFIALSQGQGVLCLEGLPCLLLPSPSLLSFLSKHGLPLPLCWLEQGELRPSSCRGHWAALWREKEGEKMRCWHMEGSSCSRLDSLLDLPRQ